MGNELSSKLNDGCDYECQKQEKIKNEKIVMQTDKKLLNKAKTKYENSKDIYYTSVRGPGWDRDKNAKIENTKLKKNFKNTIKTLNNDFNDVIKNYSDKLLITSSQKRLIDRNKIIKVEKNNILEQQRNNLTSLNESVSTKDRKI